MQQGDKKMHNLNLTNNSLKNYNYKNVKQTNLFLVCIDYFFKREMKSERGVDNDMFCTFHTSHCYDLALDKVHCIHRVPCSYYEVYVQHVQGR